MDQKKWNKYLFGVHYPASMTGSDEDRKKEARYFIKQATENIGTDEKILVLGAGDGYELECLRHLGYQNITGISILEEEAINGVVQGDIHDMPFEDGEFDATISKETLEHMLSPAIALGEINRVTRQGGAFIHYIPSGPRKQRDWYHYNCFPDWVWVDLMYKSGFEILEVRKEIWQLRYEGRKRKEPGWMKELYNLEQMMEQIRKGDYESNIYRQPYESL